MKKKMLLRDLAVILFLYFIMSQTTLADSVVYQANTEMGACWIDSGKAFGDDATISADLRTLTYLETVILVDHGSSSPPDPFEQDCTLTLYENDGPDGLPGTIIWQTTKSFLIDENEEHLSFDIPYVTVPTTFSWGVDSGGYHHVPWVSVEPPDVGFTDEAFLIRDSAGVWARDFMWTGMEPPDPVYFPSGFWITITAVPEPATICLFALGGLVLRKRK